MLYDGIKLVRFTGVPLNNRWSVETYIDKKTNSGLKQNNVPQRVGAHQRGTGRKAGFFMV